MNERDRAAADDWMRSHLPDPGEFSLEDSEEHGDTQSYFFLRYRDSATVVYKIAVTDGRRMDGFAVYLNRIPLSVRPELRLPNLTCPLHFAASKK